MSTEGLRRWQERQRRQGEANRLAYRERQEHALTRLQRYTDLPLRPMPHLDGFLLSTDDLEIWLDAADSADPV